MRKFRIRFEKFVGGKSGYVKKVTYSDFVEDVNYTINELFHDDDIAAIYVDVLKDGKYIECNVTDDHTIKWKEYSHKFYLTDYK